MAFARPQSAYTVKPLGGPANLGDKQSDTEGRSIFRTGTARKDPEKIRRINALRGEDNKDIGVIKRRLRAQSAPSSRAKGSDSVSNILASYANPNKDKIWEPQPVQGKFGPAELGDRQENTVGRSLFRHNPGGNLLKAAKQKEENKENVQVKAINTDINKLLSDLSYLQRTSIFPGVRPRLSIMCIILFRVPN